MVLSSLSLGLKRLPARFFRLDSGREPVRVWLKSLAPEDRRTIGDDIRDVEFSWPIGMPVVGNLGGGLWEVRSKLKSGKIARVIFTVEHGAMVLLHGFIKKTQKTPKRDLELARQRTAGGVS
ncbi:MAG: type II toxin-antitoxin system RelE/ParE family toxin [Acidobacteria bacterium]|nr:type II toxin-antitoxin system RelE/ParE family toxin [Acidobacteriota bacterium]